MLTVDHKGTIVPVNDRFAQWLGISAPEVVGTPLAQHFTKASRIVFETSIVPLLTLKGQVEGASLDLVTRDGVKVPVLLSAERGGRRPRR
nr:PAS domain-containing protein [Gymnodinialimonas phycosphaerae]